MLKTDKILRTLDDCQLIGRDSKYSITVLNTACLYSAGNRNTGAERLKSVTDTQAKWFVKDRTDWCAKLICKIN